MLHDVGHAPFSHTGERFYLFGGERKQLHEEILWKAEAEFQAIFQGGETKLDHIEKEFIELKKYLEVLCLPFIINDRALQAGRTEIQEINGKMQNADEAEK